MHYARGATVTERQKLLATVYGLSAVILLVSIAFALR